MKSHAWSSLFLILFLVITGCGPAWETPAPTQTNPLPSFTIPPATTTPHPPSMLKATITVTKPSPTFTPTNLLTPVATLEPEFAQATLEPLLRDPLNCSVPCFWGIIPGETELDEAKVFFSRLGFIPFEGYDRYSGEQFYTISYEISLGRDSTVILSPISNNKVMNLEIEPEIVMQEEGSPRKWIAYSPETLIRKFGAPSRVQWWVGQGENFVIDMILYFDDLDLITFYEGYNMFPRSASPRVCPLTDPFDLVRLWMGDNPPHAPAFDTVPLEQATNLTIEQFTQLMLGDPQQACVVLNGDAFQ